MGFVAKWMGHAVRSWFHTELAAVLAQGCLCNVQEKTLLQSAQFILPQSNLRRGLSAWDFYKWSNAFAPGDIKVSSAQFTGTNFHIYQGLFLQSVSALHIMSATGCTGAFFLLVLSRNEPFWFAGIVPYRLKIAACFLCPKKTNNAKMTTTTGQVPWEDFCIMLNPEWLRLSFAAYLYINDDWLSLFENQSDSMKFIPVSQLWAFIFRFSARKKTLL